VTVSDLTSPFLLVSAGTAIVAAGALIAILLMLARAPRAASLLAVIAAVLGCAVGIAGAALALDGGASSTITYVWQVPGGAFAVGVDPLSSFFLVPIFILGAVCAIYGRRYLGPERAGAAAIFNLLVALMALVVLARHAVLLLVAWEAMTLAAYLLITIDHAQAEARRAGWAYLVASHVGVTALIALVLVLGQRAGGSFSFTALAHAGGGAAWPLLLALVGFGIKAGIVGLHVWLPEAHAAAPSHISSLMSGALIKLGLYGILRVTLFVPPPPWFGIVVITLGITGAVVGISFALYQRDAKRVLAYSSVENIGIIVTGLGLAMWARARGDHALATIAAAGALLHVWNHAAMKGLMFLGAGSVLHATGTKDVERTGGLLRLMPITGRAWIFGAVAIAGLPPLNGFTGEWLIYRALSALGVRAQAGDALAAIAAVGALALAGGLAALCFVRLIGVVLLGTPRADAAAHAHESSRAMTTPILLLGALCVAAACVPAALVRVAGPVLSDLAGASMVDITAAATKLTPIGVAFAALAGGLALAGALVAWRTGHPPVSDTWGCGYAAPTARMQYTGRSFSEIFVERLLPRWLRPRQTVLRPEGLFPQAASYATETSDPLTRGAYEPLLERAADRVSRLRWLQRGQLHIYLLYIVVAVIVGLGWMTARDHWGLP
jgi:formate hydrogenlyase subunit 3/multisubunit Na+/H+ antiporter MnhD subunit